MQKMSSRPVVLALFGAAFLVYFVMLLVTVPTLREFSGGLDIFDLNPFAFERGEAAALLDALGAEGRSYYLWRQLPLDFLYPALMGAALSSGIIAIRRYAGWTHRFFAAFPLIPLIAAGLDYVENVHVVVLLASYPSLPALVTSTGVIVGIVKSAFYVLGITACITSLVAGVFLHLKRRSSAS